MPTPLVSVIMPCYNGEAYLSESIDSVLNQDFTDFELIVVDDGSTDNSIATLRSYGSKIRIVNQDHTGVSAARNTGISMAKGEFIAFLDCDDYWAPNFLSDMVTDMNDPGIVLTYCGWQSVGVKEGQPFIPPDYETPEKLEHLLRFACLWPIHAVLVRRDILPKPVVFNPDYPACEDYDLWLRIAAFNRIRLVPKVLAFYRKHDKGQATDNQATVAHYNLLVKRRFIDEYPSVCQGVSLAQLRNFCTECFIKRGYDCLWKGELRSAHRIFRSALRLRLVSIKDLKYALPTLLPYSLYCALLKKRGYCD